MTPESPSPTAPPHDGVGDAIRVLAELMPVLPVESVRQLHFALGARLALPSAATLRRQRLAVLLDFIAAVGRAPTASEYRDAVRERRKRGEPGLPLSTLEGHYGAYAAAVDAAAKLYARGTAARVQARARGHKPPLYWTEERCLDAVQRCRDVLGHWPSALELAPLRRAGEALRATTDWRGLVLPWPKVTARLFGSDGEMLRIARQRARDRAKAAADVLAQPNLEGPSPDSSRKGRPVRRRKRSTNVRAPRVPRE